MAYIGNEPTSVAFLTDSFSGNGSTTAFTLSAAPANTSSILVAISGVLQDPSTYSVSGTTLTFSPAPPTGTGNISVRFLGIPASGVTTTAYRTQTEFTATAGQTTFSVPSYTVGYIDVYRNGALLGSADFTATNGTTVVLANAASAGDLVETVSFYVSSVLNAIPATAGAVTNSYLLDSSITKAKMAASGAWAPTGTVLQVVSTAKTDTFSTTSTSFTDVTGLSVSITPTSSSSTILVLVQIGLLSINGTNRAALRIVRGSTAIDVGATAGSRTLATTSFSTGGTDIASQPAGMVFLDSPATTSATTYKVQAVLASSADTLYLNRNATDTDSSTFYRTASTITVMEIAG
jgi:hypothetical protein